MRRQSQTLQDQRKDDKGPVIMRQEIVLAHQLFIFSEKREVETIKKDGINQMYLIGKINTG